MIGFVFMGYQFSIPKFLTNRMAINPVKTGYFADNGKYLIISILLLLSCYNPILPFNLSFSFLLPLFRRLFFSVAFSDLFSELLESGSIDN